MTRFAAVQPSACNPCSPRPVRLQVADPLHLTTITGGQRRRRRGAAARVQDDGAGSTQARHRGEMSAGVFVHVAHGRGEGSAGLKMMVREAHKRGIEVRHFKYNDALSMKNLQTRLFVAQPTTQLTTRRAGGTPCAHHPNTGDAGRCVEPHGGGQRVRPHHLPLHLASHTRNCT